MKTFYTQYPMSGVELTNVTGEEESHLEALGAKADAPDYRYANYDIWEGGMGMNLFRSRATGRYYVND